MKLLALILSLYIAMLTGIPCCLYDHCGSEVAEQTTHRHHKDSREDCSGSCSPFFCQSCSGFIVSPEISAVPMPQYTSGRPAYTCYISTMRPQYEPYLWQPPDVS